MVELDKKLTEFAAKAIGKTIVFNPSKGKYFTTFKRERRFVPFDPLNLDSDALRLAVKLKIHIEWSFHGINTPPQVQASPKGMGHLSDVQILGDDPQAATRRAIVRAAAAIGEALL